jgi:hypothetical protein
LSCDGETVADPHDASVQSGAGSGGAATGGKGAGPAAGTGGGSAGAATGGIGASATGGLGGSGGSALPPWGHQWVGPGGTGLYLPECDAGKCGAGEECFQLTQEIAYCDAPELDHVLDGGGECQPKLGQCGCPEAGTCEGGRVCIALEVPCSCWPSVAGVCVEPPCSSPTDCPSGSVCLPPSFIRDRRCVVATCAGDAECKATSGGVCVMITHGYDQAGEPELTGIHCAYPGTFDAGPYACANPHFLTGSYYYCE